MGLDGGGSGGSSLSGVEGAGVWRSPKGRQHGLMIVLTKASALLREFS